MKKSFVLMLLYVTITFSLNSCVGCSGGTNKYENDDVYWNSINREQTLEDAGLDEAAKIERKARQDYMQGGGYTSPDGGRQIHFQGSKEQQEQLEMMDKLGW